MEASIRLLFDVIHISAVVEDSGNILFRHSILLYSIILVHSDDDRNFFTTQSTIFPSIGLFVMHLTRCAAVVLLLNWYEAIGTKTRHPISSLILCPSVHSILLIAPHLDTGWNLLQQNYACISTSCLHVGCMFVCFLPQFVKPASFTKTPLKAAYYKIRTLAYKLIKTHD